MPETASDAIKREATNMKNELLAKHEGDMSAALHSACMVASLWVLRAREACKLNGYSGDNGLWPVPDSKYPENQILL